MNKIVITRSHVGPMLSWVSSFRFKGVWNRGLVMVAGSVALLRNSATRCLVFRVHLRFGIVHSITV